MSFKTKKVLAVWFLCVSLILSTVVIGHAYDGILAFGDSLSDNGQYYANSPYGAVGNNNPYDQFGFGRWSNGPVWVEYLAQNYGLPLLDMAYGGATSGYNNPSAGLGITGLQWQVETYTANPGSISGNTLITVWAGGNDMLNYNSNPSLYNPHQAAQNVNDAIENLIGDGGRNFIVPNLSWAYIDPNLRANAAAWMAPYNYYLALYLQDLDLIPGVNIYEIDMTQLSYTGLNPNGSYKNPGGEQGPFARWDEIHPTTEAHQQIAQRISEQVPVPEPASIILLMVGFGGLVVMRRKMK